MTTRRIDYKTPDGRRMFVDLELNGIAIGFEGCGTKEVEGAAPIYISFDTLCHPYPVLRVWADINNPDPTFIVSLKDAMESEREDGSCP